MNAKKKTSLSQLRNRTLCNLNRYEVESVQEDKTEENKFRECMEGATYKTYAARRNACRNSE